MIIKKCEPCGNKYQNYECCLKYTNVKNIFNIIQMLMLQYESTKKIDENLHKRLTNTSNFLTMISTSLFLQK